MARPYRLQLKRLDFISAVDAGAQGEISNVALIKRAPVGEDIAATFAVAKTDSKLGLVFGWAMAGTTDGGKTPHVDLQDDWIDTTGDDFIKSAAEFMENAAASDVMHDGSPDGKIVFCMPLVPAVNEALGIKSDVHGLAIAMKPSPETFKRFLSGELKAFSIGGIGERSPLEKSARVIKFQLKTDIVDGHQHVVCIYDCGDPYVQSATSEGMECSHSHGIVRGENGALEILLDSGHTHVIAAGQPDVVAVPEGAVVVIAARSPTTNHAPSTSTANKSTHPTPTQKVNTMKTEAEQILDLTKRNERLASIAKLNGAHKTLFDLTPADEQDAFLAKSSTERDALVTASIEKSKAESEVVYTSKSTGETFSKRDDARLIAMAKRLDESAEEVEKADIRKAAAACLGNVAGDDATHDYIVKSIRKGGGSKEQIDAAIKSLSSANTFAKSAKTAKGFGGTEPTDPAPTAELDALVTKFATEHKTTVAKATDAVLATPEGARLYAAIPVPRA